MKTRILSILLLSAAAVSCIRNDIPYPVIVAQISSLSADGTKSVTIDAASSEVLLDLEEATDMKRVNVTKVEFNDPMVKPSAVLIGRHDLSRPFRFILSTYDDYQWSIRASQTIERYCNVGGQVGASWIDVTNRRVIAYLPQGANLGAVNILSLKLGPSEITTYDPDPSSLTDFRTAQTIDVSYRDVVEQWTIFVEEVEQSVTFDRVDAWSRVAWLSATGVEERSCGFRIRRAGEEQWTEVEGVEVNGGAFSAAADALEPLTAYECVAYCGDEVSAVRSFETEAEMQLPNSGFETFSRAESSKYYSFYDPDSSDPALQTKWWGCGNKGSTTVGSDYAITMPDGDDKVEGSWSLRMESRYVVIKFAAGNVFSGEYARTIGTSGGVINMGRPFTLRPRKLTLWLKYKCGKIQAKTIGDVPEGESVKVGDNDRASVWVALGDWDYRKYGGTPDSPVSLNTTDKSTFFDPQGENVIAYGRYVVGEDVTEWTKVEVPLDYRTTSKAPTHIIVSCAASMLGDYFTGSPDSVLWIDDVRLEY